MADIDDNKLVNFRDLLSGPLFATLHADFAAAEQFVDFVTKYGLEEETAEDGTSIKKLKMFTFTYNRYNPQLGKDEEFSLQVPLLSLIPLPLLQVDHAEFEFNIRLYAETKESFESNFGKEGALTGDLSNEKETQNNTSQGFKARLSPTVGRKDGETVSTTDSNMKVKVVMRQGDLPAGIANLITIFNDCTSVRPHQPQLPQSSS
jgi:hypothetical protein